MFTIPQNSDSRKMSWNDTWSKTRDDYEVSCSNQYPDVIPGVNENRRGYVTSFKRKNFTKMIVK